MRLSGAPVPGRPDLPGHAVAADAAAHRARSPTAGWAPASSPRPRRPTSPTSTRGWHAAGRSRADLDVCQGAEVAFAADEDELARMVADRQARARVQPRRHGLGDHQLLQRRLQPPGLGRGRRAGAGAVAARRQGRRGRAGHRRDGAGHHADRHRADGPRAPARCGRTQASTRCGSTRRAETLDAQVATLGRAIELVREVAAGGSATFLRLSRRNVTLLQCAQAPAPAPARSARPAGRPGAGRTARRARRGRRGRRRRDRADVGAPQRLRAPPAVAAHSASAGVMPISRTASAMQNGIDDGVAACPGCSRWPARP